MEQDIFEEWCKNKFIIVPRDLHNETGHLVVLTDFSFWVLHDNSLEQWCLKNNCKISGMTVVIPNDETLTLFSLAWA